MRTRRVVGAAVRAGDRGRGGSRCGSRQRTGDWREPCGQRAQDGGEATGGRFRVVRGGVERVVEGARPVTATGDRDQMDVVEQPIRDRHGQRLVAGEDLLPAPADAPPNRPDSPRPRGTLPPSPAGARRSRICGPRPPGSARSAASPAYTDHPSASADKAEESTSRNFRSRAATTHSNPAQSLASGFCSLEQARVAHDNWPLHFMPRTQRLHHRQRTGTEAGRYSRRVSATGQ